MNKKKYSIKELMEIAIEEGNKSIPEHTDKTDPMVGAIITDKDGMILKMAHRGELREGEHCEFALIERKLRDKNINGSILYVTLEPCTDKSRNNNKKRASIKKGCSSHIKKARISKVYIGIEDPNPHIATKGIQYLLDNDIEVEMFPEYLADKIREINAVFIKEKEEEWMGI